ncbi:MAG: radical SAM family heme chaperone HemW [Flavobacteriales bacterium]|nr:radical SAM family heme chaperone HemW [Flavobacteriales bacterium]
MAGIYLHIPFCKQACHYCDFHFSTSLKGKDDLLNAIHREMVLQKNYLEDEKVETIYLGGGTPSLLEGDELKKILDHIYELHEISADAEITLEANPDDLTQHKIRDLKSAGVNRLSIGIQSFRDEDLKLMNRVHTATQADYSVKCAQDSGFHNITIDLIYSLPEMALQGWKDNLQKATQLHVPHISAYCLTFEDRTPFGYWLKEGKMKQEPDQVSREQFLVMVETLTNSAFEHYEVSNFAKQGFQSRHNTSYWQGKKYLGLGPSAHSFNGTSRQWNVPNNQRYIHALNAGKLDFNMEPLDKRTQLNEYLMTGLRTNWGIDLGLIQTKYDVDFKEMYGEEIDELKQRSELVIDKENIRLTTLGFLRADRIASDFFILES